MEVHPWGIQIVLVDNIVEEDVAISSQRRTLPPFDFLESEGLWVGRQILGGINMLIFLGWCIWDENIAVLAYLRRCIGKSWIVERLSKWVGSQRRTSRD